MMFRTIRSTGANILQSWATYIRIVISVIIIMSYLHSIIIIVIITSMMSYLHMARFLVPLLNEGVLGFFSLWAIFK